MKHDQKLHFWVVQLLLPKTDKTLLRKFIKLRITLMGKNSQTEYNSVYGGYSNHINKIVNYAFIYHLYLRCFISHSPIPSCTMLWRKLCKAPTCSSGAIGASASCSSKQLSSSQLAESGYKQTSNHRKCMNLSFAWPRPMQLMKFSRT